MLLNTISPSILFPQSFDSSPTLRKSENVLSIPVNNLTNGKKNRIFTIKCSQKLTEGEEEAVKNKKLALAEWLSTKKPANDPSSNPAPQFKSTGTPSAPSRPKLNSKSSPFTPSTPRSYGQPPKWSKTREPASWTPEKQNPNAAASETLEDGGREVVFGNNGLAYRVAGAPFEFQYSYTETPKVKPLSLREAAFVPFGPTTMPRPWTGRAPLPPSKKNRPEFDSFKLPPPNKKGVKHIQPPGPFLEGQGPKYVKTREEILGEPLTREEIKHLVESSCHATRQLNIGRDGLTHNMLENIHAHWKRRRVCKIKCKGVATVDMDNICNQLEDKTGGKIIYRTGGAVYLFRGRNYNYKTRPMFPMMLWKPVAAVYPRLIEHAPGGLTIEEANEFRKKGRSLLPICKLAKNGVYLRLVKDVRDAFEVSDLVRVDCQGLKASDYKKIGAKLKDLVPCVLLSFEYEHILMWRGKHWKPNEQGVGASEAHSDRECSVADSIKDTTRYAVMTNLPFGEKSGSEHLVSEYAPSKENVPESNSMPSENVADEAIGDKDGIPTNLGNSTGLQRFVKNADDTNCGEFSSFEENLSTSSFSEVELEELIESNGKEIFSDGDLISDVSVSATKRDTECLGEDSAYNSQTSSSSKVELEERLDSSEVKVFSDGEVDFSVSVLSTNTDEQCLGEDSAQNSQASDVPFFYGDEDPAISTSKQLSEDSDALSITIDDVSFRHPDLNSDSSKRLTESFFPAAETSMVGEYVVESTDKESNLYLYGESKLYANIRYPEETNGQENDDTITKLDGNELIANSTSEISQGGIGFHIETLWGEAIDSGRVLLLDESASDPDIIHEKAVAFAKDAPEGPFFKRRFSRKKMVKKPWKRNSHVKTNESEGQKSAQRSFSNGGESFSFDDLPLGGLPIDELAKLLAQ